MPLSRSNSQAPRAIEPDRGQAHAGFDELALRGEIAPRDLGFRAARAGQPRQLRRNVPRLGDEQLAARVEQAVRAPARRGHLLDHADAERARPPAFDRRAIYPRQLLDGAPHGREVDADQAHVAHARLHGLLDLAPATRAGSAR